MIKVIQNPNFQNWFTLVNNKTNETEEIAGKKKAVRVALKIAKRIGQKQVVVEEQRGWTSLPV